MDDQIPFEIPKEWEWCRITNIATSQLGKTLDRGKDQGKEYPYLCSINVYWEGIDLSKVKTFKLQDDELERYRVNKGDLLICEGGDYSRCAVWERDDEIYYQNALHRVRFFCDISPYFFKYVVELYRQIGYIVGQGQTIKHFTYENMKGLLFPLPSVNEQNRIRKKIDEILPYLAKYSETYERESKLNYSIKRQLKKSILQEAIQGKLVEQNPDDEPASVLFERIREEKARLVKEKKIKRDKQESIIYRGDDNKYYEKRGEEIVCIDNEVPFTLPKGWEWTRFGSIVFNRDSERIPLSVEQRKNHNKLFDYYGASGIIDKVEAYLFDKPLLLIGEDGANLINRSTPIAFIARGMYWVNNHAHVIDCINSSLMEYLCLYINAISLVDYVTGTAQPKMNQEKMNSILVALPPTEEQSRIVERVNRLFQLSD